MRNAIKIDGNMVVTIDNSGCIGEKEHDEVHVPNEIAAYYTARVALLEQWCAGAHPTNIFLSNFTSQEAWNDYLNGIQRVFSEIGEPMPPINGSTESNFKSLQSGLCLMMIGKVNFKLPLTQCRWFVVGKPLVGQEVIEEEQHVAKLNEIYSLLNLGIAKQIWPVGSKGIGAELERIFLGKKVNCLLPLDKSSGPSTSVIVAISEERIREFKEIITTPVEILKIL